MSIYFCTCTEILYYWSFRVLISGGKIIFLFQTVAWIKIGEHSLYRNLESIVSNIFFIFFSGVFHWRVFRNEKVGFSPAVLTVLQYKVPAPCPNWWHFLYEGLSYFLKKFCKLQVWRFITFFSNFFFFSFFFLEKKTNLSCRQ